MKRKDALTAIRIAGYHNDMQTYMRIYVESRMSLKAAQDEYQRGIEMKTNGMACSCAQCQKQKEQGK